jgi:hypothetical protein
MCGLVCPSRTSEREGKGYCVKGGWPEEGERVKERARSEGAKELRWSKAFAFDHG